MKFIQLWIALALLYSALALAHQGPTDNDGCHIDPYTGQYHCH